MLPVPELPPHPRFCHCYDNIPRLLFWEAHKSKDTSLHPVLSKPFPPENLGCKLLPFNQ